jgi:DNA-binding beta-propeller fold protein YncE
VVNTSSSTVATLPVGANPVAVAESPDGSKVYVANQDSDSISAFNTKGLSPRPVDTTAFPGAFKGPHWIVVRSDNQRVYVLNSDGSLVTIDPTTVGGTTDTVIAVTSNVGANSPSGSPYMVYDGHLNRLYVPSGAGNAPQVAVVDVSSSQPPAPVILQVAAVSPSSRGAQDPCSVTSVGTLNVVSAAALPDGSRFYVGAYYDDGNGNFCPQVTVFNTSGNTFKTATAVPGFPNFALFSPPVCALTRFRFTMAAGGDSSRVYLASCDGGNVNEIDTSTDTYLLSLPAPVSSRPPISGTQPPPQNPLFMIAGP